VVKGRAVGIGRCAASRERVLLALERANGLRCRRRGRWYASSPGEPLLVGHGVAGADGTCGGDAAFPGAVSALYDGLAPSDPNGAMNPSVHAQRRLPDGRCCNRLDLRELRRAAGMYGSLSLQQGRLHAQAKQPKSAPGPVDLMEAQCRNFATSHLVVTGSSRIAESRMSGVGVGQGWYTGAPATAAW
jgi:hypothetical protein